MKAKQVTIKMKGKGSRGKAPFETTVYGKERVLLVTKSVNTRQPSYAVTHAPSGQLVIDGIPKLKYARKFASIAMQFCDWTKVSPANCAKYDRGILVDCWKILRRASWYWEF